MSRIDTQFAEDVLTVGGNGVDTGEAFCSNLLRRLTLCNGPDDFRLCLRQDTGPFLVDLLLVDDNL